MLVDESLLKYVFSRRNIESYIIYVVIICSILFCIIVLMSERVLDNSNKFYVRQLEALTSFQEYDIRLLCSITNCKRVYMEYGEMVIVFNRKKDIIRTTDRTELPSRVYGAITTEFNSVIKFKEYTFVVDDDSILDLSIDLYIIFTCIILLLFTYIYLLFLKNAYKSLQFDKGYFKNYIENKSQRNITETIHHEMGIPIAIIRSLTNSIYGSIFNENCKFKRSYDMSVQEDISNINKALDRLDAILEILRGSKQVKNENNTISIYDILSNIISTASCFKIGVVKATYINKEAMESYRIDKISNGMFLNIVQVMVNNSIEAKSTDMEFSMEIIDEESAYLYVKDNGMGIRDKANKIVDIKNTEYLYKYGYSTKNKDGSQNLYTNRIYYFLHSLGIHVYKASKIRGIGLNLNKELLNKVGGDIVVEKTSTEGTIFKLTMPISKKAV